MDLGAFLRPDADLPVMLIGENQAGLMEARLMERRRRPVWLCPQPCPVGLRLVATCKLPGFKLEGDGSLMPSRPDSEAELNLMGQVKACRLFKNLYIVRLKLLGRIFP